MARASRTPHNRIYLVVGALIVAAVGISAYFLVTSYGSSAVTEENLVPQLPLEQEFPHVITPGSTLYTFLRGQNVSPQAIHTLAEAAKPVFPLNRLVPGTRFQLTPGPTADLASVKIWVSPTEIYDMKYANGHWTAQKIDIKVDKKIVTFIGNVSTTLWESAEDAKMDPNLISDLAEIFAWQVDFAREVRVNDRWRLSVEQRLVNGKPIGWGRITSAEYENQGYLFSAVLFRNGDQDLGYFAPDGSSLRKMFLKSPLKFGRITSGFSRQRFHPVLKVFRAHMGIDYGAPIGTPVRAVGSGIVTLSGWSGGGGNVLKIRHNSTYETAYKHLSGFAKGVRSGSRVQQGQVVAYTGNTGLSTGPHLHFEFYENGRFINPNSKKFPTSDPVPSNLMAQFTSEAVPLLKSLPSWSTLPASPRGSASADMESGINFREE